MTFDPGGLLSGTVMVRSMLVRGDGTILFAGSFTTSAGHHGMDRLLPDGQYDPTFDPGTGMGGSIIYCMVERSDGKLLVGGDFSTFNGVARASIAQLNTDGSVDAGFNPGTGFTGITPSVRDMTLQADGKVVAVGWFVTYQGVSHRAWVRINTDGSVDPTFASAATADLPQCVIATPDGRFILGGNKTSTLRGIIRVNADGAVDAQFNAPVGVGTGEIVYALATNKANTVLIGGQFRSYESIGRNGVARVWTATSGSVLVSAKVMLEGPYSANAGLMSDALRTNNLVPTTEPYTLLGATGSSAGGESVAPSVLAVSGSDAIVDWILLELRDAALPAALLARRCALVQRDGDVVDVDGSSPVSLSAQPGNYHLAVRHRNHLGVMTATSIALSGSPLVLDFTSFATPTFGTAARKSIGGAFPVQALWAGDVSFNKEVKYTGTGNDRDLILSTVGSTTPNNTVSLYSTRDVNMDGMVKYTGSANDRDPILVNVGSTTPNNVRTAQLP
jgi:uncharacterized delta-60 repeat protein